MFLAIPIQNPTRFYPYNYTPNPKYRSRLLKDYKYVHTVFDWQQHVNWAQKWQTTDTVKFQIMTDMSLSLQVYNNSGVQVANTAFAVKSTSWHLDGTQTCEASFSTNTPGFYYFCIAEGSNILAISECQEFVVEAPNTLMMEYKHRKNFGDVAFDTGIEFEMRIPAILSDFQFGSEDVFYHDQKRNNTIISSEAWPVYTMTVGDQYGIPDYFAEIINKAFSLSSVKLDGTQYCKAEAGAKLERSGEWWYSRAGWKMDVIEARYRESYGLGDAPPPQPGGYMLQENGFKFILENDGGFILLENS